MPLFCSRRTSTILLTLLGLFLVGAVIVLTTATAYFSIDNSAYVLPEELGTWDEIRFGSSPDGPDSWAARLPWLAKLYGHDPNAITNGSRASPSGAVQPASPEASAAPTWRDNTPRPYDPANPPEKIPRIIHQTWKDEHLPPRWQAVRDECAAMHPDYEYMLWTDAESRKFIAEHYPWFIPVFDAYPYPIQRADAIRYFVLHHYGGVYMDLDVGCNRRLDPLLRFEVVLPRTRPIGVSNDIMLAQKGHPFMDQVIHNLITFNHQYLTNYPTVMFSTGPMFLSASYGLYVDAHGPATPSTPSQPSAGFSGVRVLPKSLYGKNAKPSDVPDAFFAHFYGSSWHSNDAGFLIFLRDHGRLLMFIGACVVGYGFFRTMVATALFGLGSKSTGSRRRSRSRGRWIGLPVGTGSSTLSRHRSKRRSTADDRTMPLEELAAGASSSSAASGSRLSMPSNRSQRLSLPLFQLQEQEAANRDAPQSVLAWVGQTLSRPSSRNEGAADPESSASTGRPASPRVGKKKGGVLYLPAYFVSRGDESSSQLSPSSSISSVAAGWQASGSSGANNLTSWAASLLPDSWRGPSPAPSHASRLSRGGDDIDLESVGSASCDEEEYGGEGHQRSRSAANKEATVPLLRNGSTASNGAGGGRFARSWTEATSNEKRNGSSLSQATSSPDCYDQSNPMDARAYGGKEGDTDIGPNGTLLAEARQSSSLTTSAAVQPPSASRLLRRLPSSGDFHAAEDTPIGSAKTPPPPYPYGGEAEPSSGRDKLRQNQAQGLPHGLRAPQPKRAIDTEEIEADWDEDCAEEGAWEGDGDIGSQTRRGTVVATTPSQQQQPLGSTLTTEAGADEVVDSTERV
ncbi:uncharacterized protein PFL1_05915 [Pseudozyma flocculosa PF-1]|uniref:Related to SUR1 - required for mannosylation of sphingolipids n=2 Tax=Pseudozyma flocculosa TaxID=84751 RepID=A0A5C3F598_9BASI|nr:uncharacterized protein PFL1_05915 [Pseudozyma flocculosa PF-1]EPQ26594.1 hypothetical protein PFL1_05915 [Pseudozyma flocculosa PF-1]SPO38411.1 related to SUR1 - required for mannosylation of sphingolipids [Pseudozyma flocculosa]